MLSVLIRLIWDKMDVHFTGLAAVAVSCYFYLGQVLTFDCPICIMNESYYLTTRALLLRLK